MAERIHRGEERQRAFTRACGEVSARCDGFWDRLEMKPDLDVVGQRTTNLTRALALHQEVHAELGRSLIEDLASNET